MLKLIGGRKAAARRVKGRRRDVKRAEEKEKESQARERPPPQRTASGWQMLRMNGSCKLKPMSLHIAKKAQGSSGVSPTAQTTAGCTIRTMKMTRTCSRARRRATSVRTAIRRTKTHRDPHTPRL